MVSVWISWPGANATTWIPHRLVSQYADSLRVVSQSVMSLVSWYADSLSVVSQSVRGQNLSVISQSIRGQSLSVVSQSVRGQSKCR